MSHKWRAFGAGAGVANLGALATRGNTPAPDAQNNAVADKNARRATAVPTEGRAPKGACPMARRSLPAQEPDKGNAATRRTAHVAE